MKHQNSIVVFNKVKNYVLEEVPIGKLLRGKNLNIKKLFLEAEKERLKSGKKRAIKPFDITATSLIEDSTHFTENELVADSMVNYVTAVFCEKNFSVFYNEDHIDLAKKRKQKTVQVRRFLSPLTEEEKFAIQLRYCSKESPLDNMARMEAIRYAIDELKWTAPMLNDLMVKDKGSAWSVTEIKKEYLVGKVYEEFCDYEIGFSHDRLTRKSFSFLKALMRSNEIKDEFWKDRTKREHFVNIAINAANNPKVGRLEDHITKILKHNDTKETFFTKGFLPAVEELKVKHPDADKGTFPEFDALNVKKKVEDHTVKSHLQKQITRNPTSCKTFNALMDSIWLIAEGHQTSQMLLADMIIELNPNLVSKRLREKGYSESDIKRHEVS